MISSFKRQKRCSRDAETGTEMVISPRVAESRDFLSSFIG